LGQVLGDMLRLTLLNFDLQSNDPKLDTHQSTLDDSEVQNYLNFNSDEDATVDVDDKVIEDNI